MLIRPYQPEDKQRVTEIITTAVLELVGRPIQNRNDFDDFGAFYRLQQGEFFVATDKDRVVGCIGIFVDQPQIGWVRRLYIDKSYRRQGVATSLLENVYDFCKQHNIISLFGYTEERNEAAIAMLRKQGFNFVEKETSGDVTMHKVVKQLTL